MDFGISVGHDHEFARRIAQLEHHFEMKRKLDAQIIELLAAEKRELYVKLGELKNASQVIYKDIFEFLTNKSSEPGVSVNQVLRDFETNFKQKMMRGTEAYITAESHQRSKSFANIRSSIDYPVTMDPVSRELKDQEVPQSAREKLENYLKNGRIDSQHDDLNPSQSQTKLPPNPTKNLQQMLSQTVAEIRLDDMAAQKPVQDFSMIPAERDTVKSGKQIQSNQQLQQLESRIERLQKYSKSPEIEQAQKKSYSYLSKYDLNGSQSKQRDFTAEESKFETRNSGNYSKYRSRRLQNNSRKESDNVESPDQEN